MTITVSPVRAQARALIASPAASAEPAAELAWKQADHDVFVATTGEGEYAGFVAVDTTQHIAHDRHSRRIGSYPTLAAAREALADATRPPSRGRRVRRSRLRILTRSN
ncbi:hypothetical protein [Microbacterium sp.]|uniref:hypothetical protein n=1 Tax=Microbacterium sp. TaxID=51671 RepID=UPI0028111429|nr:hypothetical protein [Microbacterium sp.]